MQRLFLFLAMVLLGCLAIPADLQAQDAAQGANRGKDAPASEKPKVPITGDAAEYINRGNAWCVRGEYEKGIANYNQAERLLDPDDADDAINLAGIYCNRGRAWRLKGDYDKAIADFNKALANNPGWALAYDGRGAAWFEKGEYDKAIADNNQALAIDNLDFTAFANLGDVWEKKGDYKQARDNYDEALKINSGYSDAYFGRANVWEKQGDYTSAIADYGQALKANPNFADAYYARGNVRNKQGDYDKAIADYNQALAVNPKLAAACNALAWLHATCPDEKYRDGKKAFENASEAYKLDNGKSWRYFETLAAAYAESRDFDKAKNTEAKAVEYAAADKSATDKEKAQAAARLELYKQNKPYRQEPPKQ